MEETVSLFFPVRDGLSEDLVALILGSSETGTEGEKKKEYV
jgi:hypothetical protein